MLNKTHDSIIMLRKEIYLYWRLFRPAQQQVGNLASRRSHLVSYRGPDGFMEELDADDWQQSDAHCQDDG